MLVTKLCFAIYTIRTTTTIIDREQRLVVITRKMMSQYVTYANVYDYFHYFHQSSNDGSSHKKPKQLLDEIEGYSDKLKKFYTENIFFMMNNEFTNSNDDYNFMIRNNLCDRLQIVEANSRDICLSLTNKSQNANFRLIQSSSFEF